MTKLLAVFATALVLAYISEQNTRATLAAGRPYVLIKDWAYVLLVVELTLFAGLRTSYNDTGNYINAFYGAPDIKTWLSNPKSYNPFTNPLFYFYESLLKSLSGNPQILIFTSAFITQVCFLRFFKRYSEHFWFSIFIYFTLGTYVFSLAAIKQVLGMALVTLAFPCLEKRQWGRYYLIILVAMLVHTYALAFAFLPLFQTRPWSLFTFLFLSIIALVMLNFESAITAFMEQANDLGKTLAEYEVFDDHTVNLFRLLVYAVPPVISFLFQKWVLRDSTPTQNLLIHMSIISLAFMSMGTQSGANMFGRMGNYFELGTVCCLPAMLSRTFNRRSYVFLSAVACVCFFGFFFYANAINLDFDRAYQSISLLEFLRSIF